MLKPKRWISCCLWLVVFVAGATLTHGVFAEEKTEDSEASSRMVISEPIHDFGKIMGGETLKHAFVIKNEGTATLELLSAKPSCGCTIVDYDKRIDPGTTGVVSMSLDTSKIRGKATKYITITTNDPERSQERLQIKAEIQPLVDVLPNQFINLRGTVGEAVSESFTLRVHPEQDMQLVSAKSTLPHVSLELTGGELEPLPDGSKSRQYKLQASLDAGAPEGYNSGQVILTTDSDDHPSVEVMLRTNMEGLIFCTPSTVYFGSIKKGMTEPIERKVTIQNHNGDMPFNVTKVSSDSEYVSADLSAIEEGNRYSLKLTWIGKKSAEEEGEVKPGVKRGTVTLTTDNDQQRTVVIPFTAYVL